MKRCEDCERLEAKLLRSDRKIVELTGESNRLGNMAVNFGSQNGVLRIQARDFRIERDDLLEEVKRLREVVRQVHTSASKALEVTDPLWMPAKINAALREVHEITKGLVE